MGDLERIIAERDEEIERLRSEVKRLQSIVGEEKRKVAQALSSEVEMFVPISRSVGTALQPLRELEENILKNTKVTEEMRRACDVAREAVEKAVEERVSDHKTIARCYGVVDSYTRDFLPIYTSVWGLIQNSEPSVAEYREASTRLAGRVLDKELPRQQKTTSPVDLYVAAANVKPRFDQTMRRIETKIAEEKKCLVKLQLCPSLKRMGRILEKAALRREKTERNSSLVFDCVRSLFHADSMKGITAAIAVLLDDSDIVIVRVKDRFADPAPGGWRDLLVNLYLKDDPLQHICEIQLCHRTMLKARSGLPGHDMYARTRNASELLERLGMDDAATKKSGLSWTVSSGTSRSILPHEEFKEDGTAPTRPRIPIDERARNMVKRLQQQHEQRSLKKLLSLPHEQSKKNSRRLPPATRRSSLHVDGMASPKHIRQEQIVPFKKNGVFPSGSQVNTRRGD